MVRRPWNHNIHYHPVVIAAVPDGASRALDVGCGDGRLARELRALVPHVTAIDRDGPSLQAASAADGGLGIEYLLDDFLRQDFAPGSFDFICSIATLHPLDAAAALRRMSELLQPGGSLAIIGLATRNGLWELPAEAAGAVAHRYHRLRGLYLEQTAPIVWPPPHTYAQMRRIALDVLPGATFRRRLLWRYSLVWTKPPTAVQHGS
jgi:SAM-dependent methyltransferase